jgi:hypothetical protein
MAAAERYTVGTVTGWPITETSMLGYRFTRTKPSTLAYVHDSAYCYRIVAEFDNRGGHTALEKAQALADELNAKEREWRASLR